MSVKNITNTNISPISPLKNRLSSHSIKGTSDDFSNILTQNISGNKETSAQQSIINNNAPALFNLENNTANTVNNLTSNKSNSILNSSNNPSNSSSSINPTSSTASDAVKIDIKGDSISFTIDMKKTNNINISVKKNSDGSYTFNLSDKTSENTNPTNTNPTNTNPTGTNTSRNSFELYNEEWMIPGRDYSNTNPAYSPVTGKPLNITLGEFYKMMDRISWDPITKTHSGTPTGQSWAQFREMIKYGLDPYITMFY